jgi:hypothetical protein
MSIERRRTEVLRGIFEVVGEVLMFCGGVFGLGALGVIT